MGEDVRPWAVKGNVQRRQGCNTDRSTLKPSSMASVKVDDWKIAVGHGVKSAVGLLTSSFRTKSYQVVVSRGNLLGFFRRS